MSSADIKAVRISDPAYPSALRTIPDPPQTLYISGTLKPEAVRVAIVGTRMATNYGLAVATELARDLAAAGVEVVSGLALGIDSAAHRGALEAGTTIAVLPSAIDNPLPKTNLSLAQTITGSGALISEVPPGKETHRGNFIIRNRIISGLSHVTVVVEGAITSGALITARAALEQGRTVMAVPGSIYSLLSVGPNQLIKDGAGPVTNVQDILAELPLDMPIRKVSLAKETADNYLLKHLNQPRTIDELTRLTKQSAGQIAAELALLELAGEVLEIETGRYTARS